MGSGIPCFNKGPEGKGEKGTGKNEAKGKGGHLQTEKGCDCSHVC